MTRLLDGHAATLPAVGDKIPPQNFGPFDMAHLARYAQASGDSNPIHLDPALAQQAGLAAPPIHGMLLMACFEPALAAWHPDLALCRLSVKFLRPVLAGQGIAVSGRVVEVRAGDTPQVVLRLMAHNEQREIAILGEALLERAGT